jgi:hypothetical protein
MITIPQSVYPPTIQSSPWGKPDFQKDYADGVAFVATPSHGGFVLSDDRAQQVRQLFPDAKNFNHDDHYWEEDCDQIVVLIAFWDELFKDRLECKTTIEELIGIVKHTHPTVYAVMDRSEQ